MDLLKELLKQNENLNEGFTDYTVMKSDSAADAFSNLCDEMAKQLKEVLKDPGNKYNTRGSVNVAMIFTEYLMGFSGVSEKLSNVAKMTLKLLEDDLAKLGADKAEIQGDYSNEVTKLKWIKWVAEVHAHSGSFKSLITKLKKFK